MGMDLLMRSRWPVPNIDKNSEKVYVYFPVEKLDTKEVKEAQLDQAVSVQRRNML